MGGVLTGTVEQDSSETRTQPCLSESFAQPDTHAPAEQSKPGRGATLGSHLLPDQVITVPGAWPALAFPCHSDASEPYPTGFTSEGLGEETPVKGASLLPISFPSKETAHTGSSCRVPWTQLL